MLLTPFIEGRRLGFRQILVRWSLESESFKVSCWEGHIKCFDGFSVLCCMLRRGMAARNIEGR